MRTLDQIRTRLDDVVRAISDAEVLDRVGDPLQRFVDQRLGSSDAGSVLRGEWLGHPLHPALTDLPIGFWTSAWFLDFGGKRSRRAADVMVALGVVSAAPTALAGLADWAQLDQRDRRLGVVHMAANVGATLCYASSLAARLRGQRVRGVAMSWAGATVATAGAFLGGHLAFAGASTPGAEADDVVDQRAAVLHAMDDAIDGATAEPAVSGR